MGIPQDASIFTATAARITVSPTGLCAVRVAAWQRGRVSVRKEEPWFARGVGTWPLVLQRSAASMGVSVDSVAQAGSMVRADPRGRHLSELIQRRYRDGAAELRLQGGGVLEGDDLLAQRKRKLAEADLQGLDDRLAGPDQGTLLTALLAARH